MTRPSGAVQSRRRTLAEARAAGFLNRSPPKRPFFKGFMKGYYGESVGLRPRKVPQRYSPTTTAPQHQRLAPPRVPSLADRRGKSRLSEREKVRILYGMISSASPPLNLTAAQVRAAALRAGVTRPTILRWHNAFLARGSLKLDTSNMGRPMSRKTPEFLADVEDLVDELEGEFDVRYLRQRLMELGHKPLGLATVQEALNDLDYRIVVQTTRPYLTEENKAARRDWVTYWLSKEGRAILEGKSDNVLVFLDEKEFRAFKLNSRKRVKGGGRVAARKVKSKTQVPSVMFLGVCGHPRSEMNFLGGIGMWPIGNWEGAVNKSKNYEPGDWRFVNQTLDGEAFLRKVQRTVVPALRQNLPHAKKITVLLDNAPGHAPVRNVDRLNKRYNKGSQPIEFKCQPPNSPDLNLLDFAAWWSFESTVRELKYTAEPNRKSIGERLIEEVGRAWNEIWDSESALNDIFVKFIEHYERVKQAHGDNDF